MKCQCCQSRDATLHVNDIEEWKTTNIVHVCFECAGFLLPKLFSGKGPLPSAAELLSEARRRHAQDATVDGDLDPSDAALEMLSQSNVDPLPMLTCEDCGMTFKDFQKKGRLGCPSCYESFDTLLAPALERIHGIGNVEHKGRKPGEARVSRKMAAIRRKQELSGEMERAVKAENYERAAELRDELVTLDNELAQESEAH